MARYRKRLFNGRRSYSKYRRYSKYRKSQFRRSGKYRRVSRFLRRYKKYGGKGFFRAQRPYQRTKFRVNNIQAPDELVMDFKINWDITNFVSTEGMLLATTLPVFGASSEILNQTRNFGVNAAKYKQVEFLSGRTLIYLFNNVTGTLLSRHLVNYLDETQIAASNLATWPTTQLVAYTTARTWVDQEGQPVAEPWPPTKPPELHSFHYIWSELAEMGLVSCKFINNAGGAKPSQRLSWRAKQSTFKALKADRTAFQINLPEPAGGVVTMPANGEYPRNRMQSRFYVINAPAEVYDNPAQLGTTIKTHIGGVSCYISYKFKVKFKGLRADML